MRAPMTVAPADGCGHGGPEVGRPLGLLHLRGEAFELAAADVFQVAPGRTRRRFFIEIDGKIEARRHLGARLPSPASTQSAIVTPSIGTNGQTSTAPRRGCSPLCVRRSIAAMRLLVELQHTPALTAARIAGEREDRPMMRRRRTGHPARGAPGTARRSVSDRCHDLWAPAFADVGNALDDAHRPQL